MKAFNPRSVVEAERPWLENWSPEAQEVLLPAVRQRRSNSIAISIIGYLSTRARGLDDGVSGPVKAEYRKILAELAADGVTPPPLKGRHGVTVTPSAYTEGRGLQSAAVASAPTPAARRAASMASASVPAATKSSRRRNAAAASATTPEDVEKSSAAAEGMTSEPPRMYVM